MREDKPIRIKVSLQGVNLVLPVVDLDRKVGALMEDIAKEFDDYIFTHYHPSVTLRELRLDGYLLNPRHVIKHVLRDGDTLSVHDEDSLIQQSFQAVDKSSPYWFSLLVDDFVRDTPLWVKCQPTIRSDRVAITAGTQEDFVPERGVLLDKRKLTKQTDGNSPVLVYEKDQWSIQVHSISEGGTVRALEASIKPSQNTQPTIRRWEINVGARPSPGKEHNIQEASTPNPNLPPIVLPPPIKEGPSLPFEEQLPTPELAKSEPSNSSLEIIQGRHVFTDQDRSVSNQTHQWVNLFLTAFTLINTSASPLSIREIKCEFENKDKQWESYDTVRLGSWFVQIAKGDSFDFSNPPIATLYANEIKNTFAVGAGKFIYDNNLERQLRAHRSFPQPLKIRYSFMETNKKVTEIIVTQVNPPLYLWTPRNIALYSTERARSDPYWFVFAEDPVYEARLYSSCLITRGSSFLLQTTHFSSTLSWAALRRMIFDAIVNKQSEILLTGGCDLRHEALGVYVRTSALIDVENKRMLGFKVEVRTTTSRTLEYFPPRPFMKDI